VCSRKAASAWHSARRALVANGHFADISDVVYSVAIGGTADIAERRQNVLCEQAAYEINIAAPPLIYRNTLTDHTLYAAQWPLFFFDAPSLASMCRAG